MSLCRRCLDLSLVGTRRYSIESPVVTTSKWARPQPPKPTYSPHRPANNYRNREPAAQAPRRDPLARSPAPSAVPQRTKEQVREEYYAKKRAREAAAAEEQKARQAASPTAQQQFESKDDSQSRWASRNALDKAKAERQAQRDLVQMPRTTNRKRRTKSAHLQKVRSQLYIPQSVTVSNLSRLLNVRLEQLQRKMEDSGFDNTEHDYVLTTDVASLLAEEFNFDAVVDDAASFDLYAREPVKDSSSLPLRPPLVTIMGHVDHGKTTLLDTLRKASVAAQEAGGITQHIGAFSVKLPGGKQITFLDTPGHSAFEAMRQRGASVTDIVVLVVAADDSVMPQTKEAIKHAHAAGVNMIVAINKIDKAGADPERVKRDLMANGIEVEEYGGEIQAIPVSGLTGKGLDELESAIVTLAELIDIRAEETGAVEGWVIEASVKRGRGNVASMIVKRGTLRVGDCIVAGRTWCRVRAMMGEGGSTLKVAGPGCPVEVTGWGVLPVAGDEVLGASNEKEAKQAVANRERRAEQSQQLKDIEAINEKRLKEREDALRDEAQANRGSTEGDTTKKVLVEVPFIIKGDVSGSIEAVVDSVTPIGNDEVRAKIVDSSVGEVTEKDILRAAASNGKILAFNVPVDNKARVVASREAIQILSHNIIYRLIDDVRDTLSGFLEPIRETRVTGEADILQIFSINTKGRETKNIAGCRITNGIISRAEKVRIVRKKKVIWEGKLAILKHVKQEVSTLGKGNECGMEFEGFEEFEQGDSIQCYTVDEIQRTL